MSCTLPPLLVVPLARFSGDAAQSLPGGQRPLHERRVQAGSVQARTPCGSTPASTAPSPRKPPRPPTGTKTATDGNRRALAPGDFRSVYLGSSGSSAKGAQKTKRNGCGSARAIASAPRSASAPPGWRPAEAPLSCNETVARVAAADSAANSADECPVPGTDDDLQISASQAEAKKASALFRRRTLQRVAKQARADRKAEKIQRKQASIRAYSHVDTAAFQRETQARVTQAHLNSMALEPGTRPARIAIVGAGPVGLWTAILLARRYTTLSANSLGPPRITCPPAAPKVDVLEQRSDTSGYGTRRIVLAIAIGTQDLLNKNLTSGRSLTADHSFSPTCSINFLEAKLRENFEQYAAAGFGSLRFGVAVQRPEHLFAEGYDVVIVAAGRQAMDDEWRQAHGCCVSTGNAEEALILKFQSSFACVGTHLSDKLARAIGGGLRIFLRPGATENQGWLWIMGLPALLAERVRVELLRLQTQGQSLCPSFGALWGALGDDELLAVLGSEGTSEILGQAMRLLDEALQPTEVSARVTTAAFWHSEAVTHRVQGADSDGWLVLAGDVGSGRPFYLGSTLNGHLHDVVTLARDPPWSQWDPKGNPFKKYVERYLLRTSAVGYRRPQRPPIVSTGPTEESECPGDRNLPDAVAATGPASAISNVLC